MNAKVTALVARVIEESTRAVPADLVLRKVLRSEKELPADEAAQVVSAVFGYFRWRGWLALNESLPLQIKAAEALACQFALDPGSFADSELTEKAVPSWVAGQVEVTPGWVRELQREPVVWLRARPGQAQTLAKQLGDCQLFEMPGFDALEYYGHKDLFRTSEFHRGLLEIQDLSSQAVGVVCSPKPNEKWWDACAGEGGKMLHLCDLMGNRGLVWATDRAGWRLTRLKRRAARARLFNYRSRLWDGCAHLPTKTLFDAVLVDAPCSGMGTWGRNPHARWTATPTDVEQLGELQRNLLSHAARAVKAGGKLVYAVCTLTRAETREVTLKFESQFPNFEPLEIGDPLDPGTAHRHLWISPEARHSNGMFVAAWRKLPG